jgi:hypothetical protein
MMAVTAATNSSVIVAVMAIVAVVTVMMLITDPLPEVLVALVVIILVLGRDRDQGSEVRAGWVSYRDRRLELTEILLPNTLNIRLRDRKGRNHCRYRDDISD